MFEQLIESGFVTRRMGTGVAMSVSVVIHFLTGTIAVLTSLLSIQPLGSSYLVTYLTVPPPPPPAAPVITAEVTRSAVKATPRLSQPPAMVLPASIPKSVAIIVEDPAPPDSVTTGGVLGGVSGGVPGAVLATLVGGALDPTVITTPSPPVPPPPKVKEATGQQVKNPIRIGGQIKYPLVRKRVNPVYPALAKLSRIEGSVVLEAVVDEQGKVSQLKYLSGGHALLIEAAIQAAGQWEFEPCNLNGEPIAIILPITVHFRLGVR